MYVFAERLISKKSRDLNLFKFISPLFIFVVSLFLISCGGPPQYLDSSQESPADIQLATGSTIDFSTSLNGFVYQHTVTIQNISRTVGADSLALASAPSSPIDFLGGSYPGTGGTCNTELAPLITCTMVFEVAPTTNGIANSPVTLSYFDGLADQTITLDLTTTVRDPIPATLAITPVGVHDYGVLAVNSGFSDALFTVTNSGELPATTIGLTGLTTPFTISSDTCSPSVVAGGSCSVGVRFAPTAQVTSNQTLSLNYNDGTSGQSTTKGLTGIGRVAGFLTFTGSPSFDFGIINQGFNSVRNYTIENTGGGNASTINLVNLLAPLGATTNCPATMTPGQTCTATITFTPTATTVTTQTYTMDYFNGFSNQSLTQAITGQGFNTPLTLTLTNPVSSPSSNPSPTLRTDQAIDGLRVRLYRDASCSTQVGNSVVSGTFVDFTPTVGEGTYQFHVRAEDEAGNRRACSAAFVDYIYDNTPPLPPSNIGFPTPFTNVSSTSAVMTWAATSTDVVDYQVGISSGAGGGNDLGGFTSKGNVLTASQAGLSLSECSQYYASVQSVDRVGLTSLTYSTSATPFTFDSAPPVDPVITLTDDDALTTNSATVNWTASSDNCGLSNYEVTVYQDLNTNGLLDAGEYAAPVLGPTSVAIGTTTHRYNTVALVPDVTHWTRIRARDNSGLYSNDVFSAPWIAFNPATLPDMIVWLDGDDHTTIIDNNGRNAAHGSFNGTMATWQDKSGSAVVHNFTSVGTRPSYDNVNNYVTFAGAGSGLTTADHSEINTALVAQRNLTVAFETSGDTATRQVVYEEGGGIRGMNIYIFNNRLYCGFYNDPNLNGGNDDGDEDQPFVSVSAPISTNSTYLVTWVYDYSNFTGPTGPDGALQCYINATTFGAPPLATTTTSRLHGHSGDVGVGQVDNDSCFEDGSCPSSGLVFTGRIYEIMLFNNTPSALDVFNVHTYLDRKWN